MCHIFILHIEYGISKHRHQYLYKQFSGYIPSSEIVRSQGGCIFNLLRHIQTDFHNDCIHLFYHKQWIKVLSPHPLQYLRLDILMAAILIEMTWYQVVLICISSWLAMLSTFKNSYWLFVHQFLKIIQFISPFAEVLFPWYLLLGIHCKICILAPWQRDSWYRLC